VRHGYVCALRRELRTLGVRPPSGAGRVTRGDAIMALSGMGPANAGKAAEQLADEGAGCLVSWGFAGALQAGLGPGTLVIPESVVSADGSTFPVDPSQRLRYFAAARNPVGGILFCADSVVMDMAGKQALSAASGAVAVDMESAAVAEVARRRSLPFVVVRAVVDPLGLSLPPAVIAGVDTFGDIRGGAFLAGLMRRPHTLLSLLILAEYTRRAGRSLRELAEKEKEEVSDARASVHGQ